MRKIKIRRERERKDNKQRELIKDIIIRIIVMNILKKCKGVIFHYLKLITFSLF